MPDAVRADVVDLGHRALGRLGARVGGLYLAMAGCAVLLAAWSRTASETGSRDALAALLTVAGLVACGVLLHRAVLSPAPLPRVAAVVAVAAATVATAALGARLDWSSTSFLATTVATAGGTAFGLATGPRWGFASCLVSVTVMTALLLADGENPGLVNSTGALVSTAVGSTVFVVLHRGFADTERALAGADAAALAHEVSRERWRTRRRTDRQLHDTVLTTLNLLTHDEFGTPHDVLRELCRRDQRLLEADTATPPGLLTPGTPPTGMPPAPRTGPDDEAELDDDEHDERDGPDGDAVTAALVRHWARSGLAVHLHGTTWRAATESLPPGTERALYDAMGECLANVHRHAGVGEANVVVMREPGVVSVLVVDAGRGFDPTTVDPDRLGLTESVRGRLAEVSGDVALWSVPGEGTSVLLSVPGPR